MFFAALYQCLCIEQGFSAAPSGPPVFLHIRVRFTLYYPQKPAFFHRLQASRNTLHKTAIEKEKNGSKKVVREYWPHTHIIHCIAHTRAAANSERYAVWPPPCRIYRIYSNSDGNCMCIIGSIVILLLSLLHCIEYRLVCAASGFLVLENADDFRGGKLAANKRKIPTNRINFAFVSVSSYSSNPSKTAAAKSATAVCRSKYGKIKVNRECSPIATSGYKYNDFTNCGSCMCDCELCARLGSAIFDSIFLWFVCPFVSLAIRRSSQHFRSFQFLFRFSAHTKLSGSWFFHCTYTVHRISLPRICRRQSAQEKIAMDFYFGFLHRNNIVELQRTRHAVSLSFGSVFILISHRKSYSIIALHHHEIIYHGFLPHSLRLHVRVRLRCLFSLSFGVNAHAHWVPSKLHMVNCWTNCLWAPQITLPSHLAASIPRRKYETCIFPKNVIIFTHNKKSKYCYCYCE